MPSGESPWFQGWIVHKLGPLSIASATNSVLLPSAPVVVDAAGPAPPAAVVRAVIPSFGREADLARLLDDLGALDLGVAGARIALDILVVDNASPEPLEGAVAGRAAVVRLPRNAGGSGGFNAGLARTIARWEEPAAPGHFLWLLDSDARVRPGTLTLLAETLLARADIAAVGPALADPETGAVYEVGGRVDRATGVYGPALTAAPSRPEPFECDYIASCCALVRRTAVERTGLMPDRFLNGDDVEWFIRMARTTGLRIACDPRAVALHPRFDRFPTGARFYGARNAFGPIDALGLGRRVRLRRALAAVGRAVNQAMMGRDDLASLHVRGLREAAAGRTIGPAPFTITFEQGRPVGSLRVPDGAWIHPAVTLGPGHAAVEPPGSPSRRGVWGALKRAVLGPERDVAVVPAYGRPDSWCRGRRMIEIAGATFVEREVHGWSRLLAAGLVALRAVPAVASLALRRRAPVPLPRAPARARAREAGGPAVSVCILSFNRRDALRRTIESLRADPGLEGAEIIVADNASTDGTVDALRAEFPDVRVVALNENSGVAGFNRGAALARGAYVLILDDDARPAPGAVGALIARLDRDPTLGAATLHPRHPATGASEWPFAESGGARGGARSLGARRWPVMGCANLVRRDAWEALGGYDESFFLYRNDCELALRLLAAGWGVTFDPALVVWHDSPATGRKSARWFELATRNWIVMCRRHGRGVTGTIALLSGWAWAHRLAGLDLAMHARVLRGVRAGLSAPHAREGGGPASGEALGDLLRLQLGSVFRRTVRRSPGAVPSSPGPSPGGAAPAAPGAMNSASSERHSA